MFGGSHCMQLMETASTDTKPKQTSLLSFEKHRRYAGTVTKMSVQHSQWKTERTHTHTAHTHTLTSLTLTLLTWTIWRVPTNASKWRMGFNSAFKGLISFRR